MARVKVLVFIYSHRFTNFQSLALNQLNGLVVLEETGSDFGTLGVEHDGALEVSSSLEGFSESGNSFTVDLRLSTLAHNFNVTVWSPWEKLSLATVIPLSSIPTRVSTSQQAGLKKQI